MCIGTPIFEDAFSGYSFLMAFEITYEIDAKASDVLIDAIRVEQTIEFPYKLAKTWIQNEVVGQVESKKEKDNKSVVTISMQMK